jgi:hypothetical protein
MTRKGRRKSAKPLAGFVYTIDATLALFLLVLTLATVVFLSGQAGDDPFASLQLSRVGRDALAVMDMTGVISTGNATLIVSTLNSTLPSSLRAHLTVYTYYYDTGSFNLVKVSDYGDPVPGNATVFGERRDFVSMNNRQVSNYSMVRMSLWETGS